MAIQDTTTGSLAPFLKNNGEELQPELKIASLHARIAHLVEQAAAMQEAAREHESLTGLVNELREANQNLVLATVSAQSLRDEAELANHRQNEFLAMLAHELRNPLAPISLASTMLARMPAPSAQLLNLQAIIQRQVFHLSRLLDDLLDAARISSGKISLLCRPMALVELLGRAVETVQVRLLDRRQRLVLDMPKEMIVNGDPVRLAQVFSNLLVNASKFTQDGGTIRLAAHALETKAVVTIADDGAGISAEVIPHIFALFTQGPRSLARSEGGLGVGLNVVRNIVLLHGGEVEAVSAGLRLGSIFTVTLPLSEGLASAVALPASRQPASRARRILVVEDNVDANDTLSMLLAHEGHSVVSAFDGVSGLAMASEHEFDVLVCDMGLPGMDGFELIAQLRQAPGVHIPFAIAISGYGQAEDRMRAIGAGFGQYFVKPVDVDALLTLIASEAVSRFIAWADGPP